MDQDVAKGGCCNCCKQVIYLCGSLGFLSHFGIQVVTLYPLVTWVNSEIIANYGWDKSLGIKVTQFISDLIVA
jgi:hypothetical protein